jgi:multiple antibiotic resistance protein
MAAALSFLHLVVIGFITLFPPVNPIGSAFIVDPFLHSLNPSERKAASAKVAIYCFIICTTTLLAGSWIFELFGISLPVVQVAGGILICSMGWRLLSNTDSNAAKGNAESAAPAKQSNIEDLLFYPIAFPITTGAGTISVILILSARAHATDWWEHAFNKGALWLGIILMCFAIYLSFAYTPILLKKLGTRGEQIVNRLSAFLVFCVGIQIAYGGLKILFSF